MSGWSFEDALAAIQSPASIPFSVLLSMDGIRLGDVHFAKVQTTLRMRSVSIPTLERWIESGKFNPNHKAEDEYSRSTGILVILNPNHQGTGLKCASVRLIVRQRNGNVGRIKDIPKLIAHAHSQLQESKSPQTFCIIVGDYEGSMGFATDPPFCTTYPLLFADKDDPVRMTFRNPQNQPASFGADILLVRQLLTRDCSPHEYAENRNNRCLIIPRGLHFSMDLFPQIVIPRDHAHHTTRLQDRAGSSISRSGSVREYGHAIPRHSWGFRSIY